MAVLTDITEGETQELGPFTLKVDGAAIDATGFTVVPEFRNDLGIKVTAVGTVRLADNQSTTGKGKFYYTPVAADFTWRLGPSEFVTYLVRWKVTDGAGTVVFFPNGAHGQFRVFQS